MKTNPNLDVIIGSSHEQLVRVDLHDAAGTLLGTLPVSAGNLTGSARFGARWEGSIEVPGTDWTPTGTDSPLSGFTGAYVSVWAGATVSQQPELVEVARLLVAGSTVSRAKDVWSVAVDLIDTLAYAERGVTSEWSPELDETCQQMIRRILTSTWPPQWPAPVFDDSTDPVSVPLGIIWEDTDPATVLYDLASIANLTLYADWDQTIIMRDPLPDAATVVRDLDARVDVTRYDVTLGRDNFANTVELTFEPVGAKRRALARSVWTYATQGGAPTVGRMNAVDNGDGTATLRVHVQDSAGRTRRNMLERAGGGDLLRLLDPDGGELVGETRSTVDDGSYYTMVMRYLAGDVNLSQNVDVEFSAYVLQSDPRIVTRTLTIGPLAVGTVGQVMYAETHQGDPGATQAGVRADALLQVMARGWATHVIEAVPDFRLEPDDDIRVTFADGSTLTSRITELTLPLTVGDPMRVAVRPFQSEAAKKESEDA